MKNSTALYDKLFRIAMVTVMASSAVAVVAPDTTKANTDGEAFKDVKTTSDYYEYVNELFERGFVHGYSDGSFKPTGLLTRAQASKILALNLGLDITKTSNVTFKDLPSDDWAYPYIAALKQAGIIDGYEDGTFKPNAPITRNQMAKIIVKGYGLEPTATITLPFTDVQADNNWAAPYIQTLFDLGITIGQTSSIYGGTATVTRANMAAFTIRSEMITDYRDNRRPDENVISSIEGNKITLDGQVYYIKKELQPLLHTRNLAVLKEANLNFIKIGTKIVGIRNLELLHGGTADHTLTLDLAGSTVEANILITGDYIKLADASIVGDVIIKKGNQKQIEISNLNVDGRLIIEGEAKRDQETVLKLLNSNVSEMVVNRDETKIITDHTTPTIKVGDNVSEIEVSGKINKMDFAGSRDVLVKGNLDTTDVTIETPIKVTLANKAHIPQVETKQYGSQLIVPVESTIGTLIKPGNIKPEEAMKYPAGGTPPVGNVQDTADVVRPTNPTIPTTQTTPTTPPPTTGNGGNSGVGSYNPFSSQTLTTNNIIDAAHQDPLAAGMIGTTVTTSNPNVAVATIVNGKINITSKGPGTATITVKEDAPSLKEAQIIVTVDSNGKITHTIKRPLEVLQDKIKVSPTPSTEELVKLFEAVDIKGITLSNVIDVTEALKQSIANNGSLLTEQELKLVVDTTLLPYIIKKDNSSLQEVTKQLDLVTTGPNGTAFTWNPVTPVDSATVDHITGQVTRSNNDDENDTVSLGFMATNGSATKNASISATIIESKEPSITKIALHDENNDGFITTEDTIELTFSEPIASFDEIIINGQNITEGTWNPTRTKWTGKLIGNVTSGDTVTVTILTDSHQNVTPQSISVITEEPLKASLTQTIFAGDFRYTKDDTAQLVVISEATEALKQALLNSLTVQRGVQTVDPTAITNVTFGSANITGGTIASGNFRVHNIQAMVNGQLNTIELTTPVTVTTSNKLFVTTDDEIKASVGSTHVTNGLVNIIEVDHNTTKISMTEPVIVPNNITLFEGNNKISFASLGITANGTITVQNIDVNGLNRHGTSAHRGINYIGSGSLILNNVKVEVTSGSIGYPGYAIYIGQPNAVVEMNNSKVDLILNRTSAPGTLTGILLSNGSTLTLNQSPIYVEAQHTASQPSFGISTGSTGTLTLNNSPITAKGASTAGVALNLPAGHSVNVNTDANSPLEEGLK